MPASLTLGSYRLIAELGHGGMADVFLAAAEGPLGSGFTKLAVVKKLRSHLAADPEFISMLMDEARITARLSHPNVVQLFEVGHAGEDFFLAMEFLEGQPLHRIEQRVARTRSAVPRDVFYSIISDVLAGLHHAHELADYDGTHLDVTHRDVSPHNVFVTYDGAVKVLDFGIAKAVGRSCETQQGIVKGKVRYMSPEQASGAHVDRRTDIFAAGVMLWNLATGCTLWGDRGDVKVARKLQTGDYEPSPRALSAAVPVEIDAICRKALAFRREDRYATADEMRADLEAFLGRGGIDARKGLASMMRDLFVRDRAKLRTVLETSGLMSSASLDALAAAVGATPREFRRPAPPRTGTPSARIQSLPSDGATKAPSNTPRKQSGHSARVARALSMGAVAATFLVVGIHAAVTATRPAPGRGALAAVVAAELTPSSREVGSKPERVSALVVTPPLPTRRNAGPVARTSPRDETAAAPEDPAPRKSAPSASETAKSARKRSAIDTADPWASTDTR